MNPHQVIRPSPKRYRPSFIDAGPLPDAYTNSNIYSPQHPSPNKSVMPPAHILDGRHERNVEPPYIIPHSGLKKHPEPTHPVHRPDPSIIRNEELVKNGYFSYPPFKHNSVVGGLKELRGYPDYPDEDIRGTYGESHNNNRKRTLENECKEISYSEVISNSNSYRAHYNSVEIEKHSPRHIHGCRMQPYRLLQRSDVMHNYRRHAVELPYYEKDMPPHTYPPMPYMNMTRDRRVEEISCNEDTKSYTKSALPSPIAWQKKHTILNSHDDSWLDGPKYHREKIHQVDPPVISRTVNNILMDEIREKYLLDYDLRESRKLYAYRKENELYSVNQYHKLVCDTVNTSLISLCQPPDIRRTGSNSPPNLKVPDQAKILKVLHEPSTDELCDSGSDTNDV